MYGVNLGRYGTKAISSINGTNINVDFTNSFWDSRIKKDYSFDDGDPITIENLQSFEANLIIDENGTFRECLF